MAPSLVKKVKRTGKQVAAHTLGALQGRYSNFGTRLLGSDGEGVSAVRGLSLSFTAAAQPFSARRTSISSTSVQAPAPGSPTEIQQFRYPPPTGYREVMDAERFVAQNRDPNRDDEYFSYSSSSGYSADASIADVEARRRSRSRQLRQAYDDLIEVLSHGESLWYSSSSGSSTDDDDASIADTEASRQLREAYSTGNDDWTEVIVANGSGGDLYGSELGQVSLTGEEIPVPQVGADPEAELESVLHHGRDFAFGDVIARREWDDDVPAKSEGSRRSLSFRLRRDGRNVHNLNGISSQHEDIPTLPPITDLTPQPRRRSRPIIRDDERRYGRVYDDNHDYVVLTALRNATANATTTEGIRPDLSGQDLEEAGRPLLPAAPDGAYADTDTTRYRALNGERRRLPPPPPPEPLTTVRATIHDIHDPQNYRNAGTTDETYHPPPKLIRSTDFRPVAGVLNTPTPYAHAPTANHGISGALAKVGGYFTGGAEVVASGFMSSMAQVRHPHHQRHPHHYATQGSQASPPARPARPQNAPKSKSHLPPPAPPTRPQQQQQPRNKVLPPLPTLLSPNSQHPPPARPQKTLSPAIPSHGEKLKALAGLILTDQEFPHTGSNTRGADDSTDVADLQFSFGEQQK
ncbi:MAG: hypothetical protein L6R39_006204 [Caloplaca ligustica]|nr:MAG: hypothetical protein L6R39_006204 [Caloplaca ligustica]